VADLRPCVILGCGRSGTSLAAGLLAEAGYDLGPRQLSADPSNPKGFFESRTVNDLNERLLTPLTHGRPVDAAGLPLTARPLRDGERWLAALPPDVAVPSSSELEPALRAAVDAAGPVARNDPPVVWTLPVWAPLLPGALRLCVFREPGRTARSILGMTDSGDLGLTLDGALAIWTAAYLRCLRLAHAEDAEDWLFVSYRQLVDGSALPVLAARLGAALPGGFADPGLARTADTGGVPRAATEVLRELQARAGTG
jgi:hypothetical protein